MDRSEEETARTQAVLKFWQRMAPKFGLPPAESAQPIVQNGRTFVFLVQAGALLAAVRWPRGSLLRVDLLAGEAARLFLIAAESGLAPRVFFWERGALELDGQPVVVSEYVTPNALPPAWFRDNIRQVAALLARLHRDENLRDALEDLDRGDVRGDCLAAARAAWADLQTRHAALEDRMLPAPVEAVLADLSGYIAWFGAQIQPNLSAFRGRPVGPAHGDVNCANWLADEQNRVYLVDWEQTRLEDPALDVGMLLHWYVPVSLWPVFVREYAAGGVVRPDTAALLTRARIRYPLHAINVCLWLVEQMVAGEEEQAVVLASAGPFLQDLRLLRAGTFGAG
jgi:thiamine kinase-like enzyme